MHGHGMGTHGWGARKKHISSGNQGGWGMSGTGKMAGHKKTLVTHLYGTGYFGKQGITFLIFILCARLLTPYNFGIYNYALAIIFFLIILALCIALDSRSNLKIRLTQNLNILNI
jgi:hypothetical protein